VRDLSNRVPFCQTQTRKPLHTSIYLSVNMADPRLLTPNLPANRLRCPDCKAFRPITDFPFQRTGFRKLSCIHCKIRRVNRRQRIQTQKTQQESSEGQVLVDPPIIFCSRCNQQRRNTQFRHFLLATSAVPRIRNLFSIEDRHSLNIIPLQ